MESLYTNKTWNLVPLPKGRKAIGNRWEIEGFKARLVVKGL